MNATPFVKREWVNDGDMSRKEKKDTTVLVLRLVEYDTDASDQDNDCCDVEVVNVNKSQKVESARQKHASNAESRGIHMSSDVSVGLVKIPKIHRNTGLKTPSHSVDPQFWYKHFHWYKLVSTSKIFKYPAQIGLVSLALIITEFGRKFAGRRREY